MLIIFKKVFHLTFSGSLSVVRCSMARLRSDSPLTIRLAWLEYEYLNPEPEWLYRMLRSREPQRVVRTPVDTWSRSWTEERREDDSERIDRLNWID